RGVDTKYLIIHSSRSDTWPAAATVRHLVLNLRRFAKSKSKAMNCAITTKQSGHQPRWRVHHVTAPTVKMFFTLFNYIDGHNADDVKIPMTAPVVTTMAHGQGPNCASNFTMHFMIPQAQWSKPIEPTDPKVHIVTLPAMDVYVRSFSGFPKDGEYTQQAADLYQSLPKSSNVTVDTQAFYSAGYDGPYQFSHRHNEVWIRRL
ncbi:hypothetical protein BaRGS_00021914, partial [Batillaria attramentaria]